MDGCERDRQALAPPPSNLISGASLSHLAHLITATEMDGRPALIENLRGNFELNGLCGEAHPLDWIDPTSWLSTPFDLVLCRCVFFYIWAEWGATYGEKGLERNEFK